MPASPADLLTTHKQLDALVKTLSRQKLVAVDTESNSLYAYREQVCLIQFTANEKDYLVDPLAVSDLSPLGPIFADPNIEKIFHAAEYDLIVLQRDFGFEFANLFDTMVAARILGRQRVGLGNMLEAEFSIKLAKKYQRADWGKRPLKPEMLDYARFDTHYLIELRDKLKKELVDRDRWAIAEEDFARMPDTIPQQSAEPNGDVWNIKGVWDLNRRESAILAELAEYRDQQAQQANRPLFKIIGDRTLTAIAEKEPENKAELAEIKGMSEGQLRRHGQALLAAVKRGTKARAPQRPKRKPHDEAYVERYEALRDWRKIAARKMEVESDVVLPRDVLERLARANPKSITEVKELMRDVPWRRGQYGADIFKKLQDN